MFPKIKFYGQIEDGSVRLDEEGSYKKWIQTKFKDGQRIELTVSKESKDQTNEQYKYLYGCVYLSFSEEFGWSAVEVDEWMKKSFMTEYGIVLPKGMVFSKAANLNREWLAKYVDFCIMKCAEYGVAILPPCQTWKEE